jgi:hypothetical protein
MTTPTWREEIVAMLDTGHAFEAWRDIVRDFPDDRVNERPPNVPYTFWQLLEHIRICQWEVLDKIANPEHGRIEAPDDVWPSIDKEVNAAQWRETVGKIADNLDALKALVRDEQRDLLQPALKGADYTALSSILSIAEHNAYHWGELAILRQVAGAWGPAHQEHDGNLDSPFIYLS